MRRWNGWGDESITVPVSERIHRLLLQKVGPGRPPTPVTLNEALRSVPESRLPSHPLFTTDPLGRLQHARGQSFPDWVDLRSGRISTFPDAVAYPDSEDGIRELIAYSKIAGIPLIPYGGGTSVVGHINPPEDRRPVLTVDMSRMSRLRHLDSVSNMATFGAGIAGPQLEAALRAHGLTLGHFPQSFEYSTLGGWIASRSSGQQSMGYGRIDQRLLGVTVETPNGTLALPPLPASSAGPDLRQLILGSEGRLGIISEATVQCSRLPETEAFHAVLFPSWEQGLSAVRTLAQAGLPLSMIRLSTPKETGVTIASIHANRLLEPLLELWDEASERCVAIVGFSGAGALMKRVRNDVAATVAPFGGRMLGAWLGNQWKKGRFRMPYLRNSLWEYGYAVDTVETALPWVRVPALVAALEKTIESALEPLGERVYAFTHLSHLYPVGSSVYTTYLFRLAASPDETLDRWRRLKRAASETIVAHGGTISHQHGVGVDHIPYLAAEKGDTGIALLRALARHVDPKTLMNPGKLFTGV